MTRNAEKLNRLGQTIVPRQYARKATDVMDITTETLIPGPGGGTIKTQTPTSYRDIPVVPIPKGLSGSTGAAGEPLLNNRYILTFPVYTAGGERIEIDNRLHRLTIRPRGGEPQKVFRVESLPEEFGVLYHAICVSN